MCMVAQFCCFVKKKFSDSEHLSSTKALSLRQMPPQALVDLLGQRLNVYVRGRPVRLVQLGKGVFQRVRPGNGYGEAYLVDVPGKGGNIGVGDGCPLYFQGYLITAGPKGRT